MRYNRDKEFTTDETLGTFGYRPGDPTIAILRTHLWVEDLLRTYLARTLPHPTALQGARLTYVQVLALAKAMCPHLTPDNWVWEAASRLNTLRNSLAHDVHSGAIFEEVDKFIQFWGKQSAVEVPAPFNKKQNAVARDETGKTWVLFDFVGYAFFNVLAINLNIKVEGLNLGPDTEEQRDRLFRSRGHVPHR